MLSLISDARGAPRTFFLRRKIRFLSDLLYLTIYGKCLSKCRIMRPEQKILLQIFIQIRLEFFVVQTQRNGVVSLAVYLLKNGFRLHK